MKKLLLFLLVSLPGYSQYCSTATPDCTARLPLGDGSKFATYYRNYPIDKPNLKIERVMIIIHGAGRNADDYFSTGMASAFLAGALDNTLVISPLFAGNNGAACKDALATNEIAWDCGDWKNGFESLNHKGVYSYDLLDALLTKIADPKLFPNLKGIVVSGHSAGGQFTHRYAAVNKVHNNIRVPVRYVVSNPSSYVYLDAERLPREFKCDDKGKCDEDFRPYADRRNCTTFNDWMHGLDKLKGYAASLTADKIREQLLTRPVTYLMGELDTLPIAGFDSSCISMAQGPTRYDRAKAYFAHVTKLKAKDHSFVTVPLCGHNNRCIWTADQALPVVFPKF
jgi:pimeloyl-ACP methyl ester carboxylesterase